MNNETPPRPDDESQPPSAEMSGIGKFWSELKRRKVMRVGITYAVVAWLIIQIASATFSGFGIPPWAFRFVTLMLILGFPVALIITWAFELTPDGIKTTKNARVVRGGKPVSKQHQSKRNWSTLLFAAGLPTVIFGALAIFFYLRSGTSDTSPLVSSPTPLQVGDLENSIAVLPLINMSAMEENTYFAGGVHEDILTNLSRIRNMEVVSRTTMLRYGASELTLREIGEALKVKFIVEGSVRRIGNHVRVTIQLIDAVNDRHMWANNFERELVDVFATQSALAREISNSIHLEIQPETVGNLANMPTSSVRAYDLFLKSLNIEKTEGETEESMLRRQEMLEQAVEVDPDFVEAWGHLKRLYDLMLSRLRLRGWYLKEGEDIATKARELQEKSKRAMEKATALDPDHFETLLASVVDHEWPQPEAVMKARKAVLDRLVDTYPDEAKAWYHMAWWHNHVDLRGENAMAAFEEALKRDPFNARIVRAVLDQYRSMGDQENIDRLVDRLAQIIPDTAEDRWLARRPGWARFDQMLEAFFATADEDLIPEMEKIMEESARELSSRRILESMEMEICALKNSQKSMVELAEGQSSGSILMEIEYGPFHYFRIQSEALPVLVANGSGEQAEAVARGIIEVINKVGGDRQELLLTSARVHYALVISHSVLGETDKAKEYLDRLLVKRSAEFDPYGSWYIQSIQWMNPEQAVALAFEEASKDLNGGPFGVIAAFHLWFPKIINHPKIQAHYLQDGKWMDYLAKRIPEYAELKKANQ